MPRRKHNCGLHRRRTTVPPQVVVEMPVKASVLPWRGRGNIIAAAGVALLDLARVR